MKKEKKFSLMLLTFFLLIPLTEVKIQALDSDTKVIIPDENLRQCILEELKKDLGYTITKEDMESIIHLEGTNKNITSIVGLEYCINLKELIMQENNITNLEPLADLTEINYLNLSSNNISDISALSKLKKLSLLSLDNNKVSDLSPLSSLKKLGPLSLSNNEISDLTPLGNLTNLISLNLAYNHIFNISPLSNLKRLTKINNNLIALNLDHQTINLPSEYVGTNDTVSFYNIIKDINNEPLTSLTSFSNEGSYDKADNLVTFNKIIDSSTVSYNFFKRLNLRGVYPVYSGTVTINLIHDTIIKIPDKNLRQAILKNLRKESEDIITGQDMKSITNLNAYNRQIESLEGLEYCTNLKILNISYNKINNISILNRIPSLEKVNASNQSLSLNPGKYTLKPLTCSIKNPLISYTGSALTSFINISDNGVYYRKTNSIKWRNLRNNTLLYCNFDEFTCLENGGVCIFSGKLSKSIEFIVIKPKVDEEEDFEEIV